MQVEDTFIERLETYKKGQFKQKKQVNSISNARLVVFLAGAAFSIFLFSNGLLAYGILSAIIFISIFITLIIRHDKAEAALKRTEHFIAINQAYLDRINGNWTGFSDNGEEFADNEHPFTGDLDIFGPKSLYQLISIANSFFGVQKLGSLLAGPDMDISIIEKRQRAVSELAEKPDFCQKLQCEGLISPEIREDPNGLLNSIKKPSGNINKKWKAYAIYSMPILTIASLAMFILKLPIPYYVSLILVLTQFVIFIAGYRRNKAELNNIYGYKRKLGTFKMLIEVIENETFEDEHLNCLKSGLLNDDKKASEHMKGLEKIAEAVDIQLSPVIYFFANILLLWDFHCILALDEWKNRNGVLCRQWLETIGCFEALVSLSVIRQINPNWILPTFTEERVRLSADELGHPLIPEKKRVCNDIEIKNNACIITGSNMSGKTTLLRTVGINLVLAYAGTPVCAEKFQCSLMSIYTSMRISDNLAEGISTFYAELLRIKKIIEFSARQEPMLFLIDEIFRGTNSKDRHIGARSVVKNLGKPWISGLISTHDLELCDLESESERIQNYHFTEKYMGNEIIFDFKLRQGRSTTTNAQHLMRMVGIRLE